MTVSQHFLAFDDPENFEESHSGFAQDVLPLEFPDVHRRNLMQGIAYTGDGGSELQTGEATVVQRLISAERL